MNELIFIRHGQTEGNLRKAYIGRTDEPLCEEGIRTAEKAALMAPPVDFLYVSPMLRCRQTAAILFPGMEQRVEEDFRECDFGIFEGLNYNDLQNSKEYENWLSTRCEAPVPGGESIDGFRNRCVAAFLRCMGNQKEGSTVGFVVHGGTIMSVLYLLAEPKQEFYTYAVNNCQMVHCCWDGEKISLDTCAGSELK